MEPVTPPRLGPAASDLSLGPLDNNAPDQPIAVRAVAVEGVTIHSRADMDALTGDLVGPAVSLRKIEAARLALVKKYRDDGYPLVSVQATRRQDGTLNFRVYEGHIVDVKLDGEDIGPAGTQVLRFLRRLTESRPIDAASLERWLLLAQDVPGIALQAVLKPADTDPGAITLVATVRRSAVNGLYTSDNRAYPLTGPYQGLAVISLNSFTSLGERTELSLYHTYNGTQIFGQASTEVFAGSSGLRIRLYGGAGNVTPSGFLQQLGYNGFTTVAGVQATYPLIRAREQTLNLIGSFDALDSSITTAGFGSPRSTASKDSLRVFRGGVDYALRDIWVGNTRPAINSALLRVSQGIAGLGATHNTATPARLGEKVNFTKVAGEFSRNQALFQPWSGASVSLLGLVAGQGSGDILPPAEKFFLGGMRYTRGYYVGQVSGDSAIALTAELQLTTSAEVSMFGHSLDIGQQYYVFYDYGHAWQNLRTDPNKETKSFGLGARVQLTRHVEVDLEGVRRLTRNVDGANASELKEYAIYWRVLTRF
jgi:hemolysin activation/secretion protein